jgi:hypothetical protein
MLEEHPKQKCFENKPYGVIKKKGQTRETGNTRRRKTKQHNI